VPFPCIVHWNQRHFVVVYAIKRKGKNELVYVADPAAGLLKYNKDHFLKCWLSSRQEGERIGTALLLETTPDFYRADEEDDQKKLTFRYLLGYLRPYQKYLVQIGMAMITENIISLIFPFLTQSIVDYGINKRDLNFIIMVLIAQVILSVGTMANNMIRSWIMLHVTTRISISLISDFLIKLMRLRASFFDVKLIGDILQRIGDQSRIQSFLTGSLINILFAVFTLVIYSFVMAGYHLGILGIFFLGSTLYVGWVLIFLHRRRELDYKRFQQAAANQSNIVQLITGMQEIKLNACEQQNAGNGNVFRPGCLK
jgi:ATP-binding cassette subfamily B protein